MHRALTPSHVLLLLLLAIPSIEGAGQGYALSLRFPPVHCEIGETPAKWFLAVIPPFPSGVSGNYHARKTVKYRAKEG